MGQYNKAVITTKGENLIARAVAGEIQLDITNVKTSDYLYPVSVDLKALIDMQGIVQIMNSPETTVLSNDKIQTRALFSNEGIETTYYIRNIGLYAMDGAEEVLFCIVTAVTPDEMPQYNGVASTSYIYNIQFVVQDASEIHITVHQSGVATIEDVLNIIHSIGQPNGIAQLDETGKVPESQLPPQQEIQDATLSQKGIVQLSNDTDSLDDTKAVTPGTLYRIRRNTSLLGTPTAPQANLGDNSSQIANTAFVYNEIRNKIFLKAKLSGLTTANGQSCMNFTQSYDLRSTRLMAASHTTYGRVWRNNTSQSIYVIMHLNVQLDDVSSDANPLRRFAIEIGTSLNSTTIYDNPLYVEEWHKFQSNESRAYTCFAIVPTGCWILPSCMLLSSDTLYNKGCTFSIAEF